MKNNHLFLDLVAGTLLLLSILLAWIYVSQSSFMGNTDSEARRVSRVIKSRVASLDTYSDMLLSQVEGQDTELGNLPQDMVVYLYVQDTLQFWRNEFSVFNDNLNVSSYLPFLVNPRVGLESPLLQVSDTVDFINIGPKWYLAKSKKDGNRLVVSGLEMMSSDYSTPDNERRRRGGNRGRNRTIHSDFDNMSINPHLHLNEGFSIRPLSETGGTAVKLAGEPKFKVVCEQLRSKSQADANIVWLSVFMFIIAIMLFLCSRKTITRFAISIISIVLVLSVFYIWGKSTQNGLAIFSPTIYAGNSFLYSLGAVLIVNVAILLFSLCVYICRVSFYRAIRSRSSLIIGIIAGVIGVVGVLAYTQAVLRSLVQNSGVSIELYKVADLSSYSFIIYVSFLTMLVSVPLLLQSIQPAINGLIHKKINAFSFPNRIIYSLIIAIYLVSTSAVLGFRKEQDRMEVLSNRLAFDRDISLEQHLASIEPQIAGDMIISALSVLDNTTSSIQNRISDIYLSRNDQNYSITAYVFNDNDNTKEDIELFNSLIQNGVPISNNSRFLYVKNPGQHSYYAGIFFYYVPGNGVSRVLLRLGTRDSYGNKGYAGIFGFTPPGKVSLPPAYSYAKYDGADLESCGGNYAYSTKMTSKMYTMVYVQKTRVASSNGYTHFSTVVGEGESIIISRAKVGIFTYFAVGIFIALLSFLVTSLFRIRTFDKKNVLSHGYFRSRISGVLSISLTLTLLAMASISIYFVYNRNDANMHNAMSEKIVNISTMLSAGADETLNSTNMNADELRSLLDRVGRETNSDITLYLPSGRLFLSTAYMLFERQLLGGRINGMAFEQIVYRNRRYVIQKEIVSGKKIYCMYAPIMDSEGKNIIAIACSPYYEENYDFEKDALTHSMIIISLFLLFLITSLVLATKTLDNIFKPLGEMSRKMRSAGLDSLEYIQYNRDDEIASIVQSYNRMVSDLSESTKVLAQAERDKAWSGMARQVAHEIKNPLTPMKLELQRIIRQKEAGNPLWQQRFDSASKIILEQIDILTETANQFSDFAKLYTEDPSSINLDQLLHEQVMLYDNRDNIKFDYIGFSDALVYAPKPQLTRVLVNLLNNAVQAIGDSNEGRIQVSLRNSVKDGYYDIVFEDSGAGVSEANEQKLFTPNFTTKSSGSGLGLAISRSILEKCGATISYSKSFTLGGACFTICYPK